MPEGEKKKKFSGRLNSYHRESKGKQNYEEKKNKVIHLVYFNRPLYRQGEGKEEHKTARK